MDANARDLIRRLSNKRGKFVGHILGVFIGFAGWQEGIGKRFSYALILRHIRGFREGNVDLLTRARYLSAPGMDSLIREP